MFKQILFTVLALVLVSTAAQAQTGWSALNDVTTINTDDEFIIYCSTCSPDANDKMRNFTYSSINSWPDIDTTGVATNDILYQSSDGNWYVQSVDELVQTSSGTNSLALGTSTNVQGDQSVVIGNSAASGTGDRATGVGYSIGMGTDTTVLGYDATSFAARNVTIGSGASSNQGDAVVVGYGASNTALDTVVIGSGASAAGNNQIIIGSSATSSFTGGQGLIGIGVGVSPTGARSLVIGEGASASGARSIVIGNRDGSGTSASASSFSDCIIMGAGVQCTENNEIKIGDSTHTMRQDGDVHIEGSLIGGMPFKEYTTSTSLTSADLGYNILFNSSGTLTATVDQIAGADSGEGFVIIKKGTGNVTISAGSGVTLNSKGTTLSTQYGAAAIQFQSADEVWVTGEVE